jgi:RNA polymerase sigma-70 factor (ECF subfamily)
MWPDVQRTAELLHQARAGDRAALDALLAEHRPALRRVIELRLDRRLGQRVDASDLVQEVLLEASQRLADYLRDPRLPFHLWLRQIAQDRVIDAHRRHRLAARRSVDRELHAGAVRPLDRSSLDLLAQLCDRQPTPAAAAITAELAQQVLQAMDALNPQDREILHLRHLEQLANQEAAQVLGLSEAAAGMRYLRALRRLRALLIDAAPPAE